MNPVSFTIWLYIGAGFLFGGDVWLGVILFIYFVVKIGWPTR